MNVFKNSAVFALALLLGFVSEVQAKQTLAPEVKDAIVLAKQIMKAEAKQTEYAKHSPLGAWFMGEAVASSTVYDCFYGGWPSQLSHQDGRTTCQNPKVFTYFQKIQAKDNCGDGMMSCNPLLFGPEQCVPNQTASQKSMTFSNCENQFQTKYKGNYPFLNDDNQKKLGKLFKLVGKVCQDPSSPQNGTGMCNKFLKKMKEIQEKKSLPDDKDDNTDDNQDNNQNNNSQQNNNQQGSSTDDQQQQQNSQQNNSVTQPSTTNGSASSSTAGTNSANGTGDQNSCTTNQPVIPKPITDVNNALKNGSVEDTYNKLKAQYFASGQCEFYSDLPPKEQDAFKLKLYKSEIRAFRTDGISPESSITEINAFNTLTQESGMTADEVQSLKDQWTALPPRSDSSAGTARAKFQTILMTILQKHTKDPTFVKNIDQRADANFQKLGLPTNNCDPNAGDFVSLAAFKEAMEARDQVSKKDLKKPDLVTILDRSLPQNARRMMTLDLSSGKVLFHEQVAFGNGDPKGVVGPGIKEDPNCSNVSGSYRSPYGYGVTKETLTESFGQSTRIFTGYNGSPLKNRGILFHPYNGGEDSFSRYTHIDETDKRDEQLSPAEILESAKQNPTESNVNWYLNLPSVENNTAAATEGCVGIPQRLTDQIESTLQNGSYVYFYCSPDKRK